MRDNDIPLLAVLIDADNTSHKSAKVIFDEIASLGEASVRRIYGDFASPQMKGWSSVQVEHGIVPHHQPANTVGKNASDIALVIDAMDFLHSGRFDGFVLVSSDSDFTRLASRIREQGLDVFGIGQRKTPESFRKACKRFILIENLKEITEAGSDQSEASKAFPPSKAVPLIMTAMRTYSPDAGWLRVGPLNKRIISADPEFDPRSYGCENLTMLLKKAGAFEVNEAGKENKVRRRP